MYVCRCRCRCGGLIFDLVIPLTIVRMQKRPPSMIIVDSIAALSRSNRSLLRPSSLACIQTNHQSPRLHAAPPFLSEPIASSRAFLSFGSNKLQGREAPCEVRNKEWKETRRPPNGSSLCLTFAARFNSENKKGSASNASFQQAGLLPLSPITV